MDHPRLTDSQLRDLQTGDRVSRYSRPGEVQTAPVARLTDTLIVVLWPDETEARYWRESGTRTNCRGEVLRMPAEEPGPETEAGEDASVCPRCLGDRWREGSTGDVWHCPRCEGTHDGGRYPRRSSVEHLQAATDGHDRRHCGCPGCAELRSRVVESMCGQSVKPSAPALPVELLTLSTPCPVFYAALGPFLASDEARREGAVITHQPGKTWVVALVDGMPVGCAAVFLPEGDQAELASAYVLPEYRHQGVYRRLLLARTALANAAGKTRIVATCTPASATILARLGFAPIGESAGYTTMSLVAR